MDLGFPFYSTIVFKQIGTVHDDEEELTDALDMKHKLGRAHNGSKLRPLGYKLIGQRPD